MARKRWTLPRSEIYRKPIFYHCISRVVDRRRAFLADDKEKFRMFMRMYEKFTGCRAVSYCLMCNHIHLLIEVQPMPVNGFTDEELLKRLSAIYNEAVVADVAKELHEARKNGTAEEIARQVLEIHQRYTYRMHDLSRFMEGLLQRFTRWFNRAHKRTGNLWEDAFKSVIVENGVAAKTISAYIDLNPVRAGMVKDPAEYRWSSYGEAIGGGSKGDGKKARAGLVRAMRAHLGNTADASFWENDVSREYRKILMEGAIEQAKESINREGKSAVKVTRKGISKAEAEHQAVSNDGDISLGKMLRCRVRYFTDGAVIGSRDFVNEVFKNSRERFGPKRKNGARKLKGNAAPAAKILWSLRDLRTH
ncbi:MAG: chemotaxis protein CheW [Akkermansiaceae bacterium]|nr:chemotaxis protein CheW [Akkermansiaceae bacterium]